MSSPGTKRDSEFTSICRIDYSKFNSTKLHGHLRKLYQTLQKSKATGALPEMKNTLSLLTRKKMLQHKMKEIRVLVACILCEVFRHCLPTHPFSSDEVISIFRLFVQELKELENTKDAMFHQRVAMLRSLSENSTCVTLIDALVQVKDHKRSSDKMDLDDDDDDDQDEDDEMLLDLFTTSLNTANTQTDKNVFELLGDILVTCIFEMEDRGVPENLLEVLLRPLIPELRGETSVVDRNMAGEVITIRPPPPSYKLVRELILFCGRNFINSICDFINDMLTERKDYSNSEIKTYLYPIIYELHLLGSTKDSPEDYIFNIMGNLNTHLRIEDEEKRVQCVALLGKMFSESKILSKSHDKTFQLFMQRFLDKSTKVRIEMIKSCTQIQHTVPELRSELLARITEKLEDQAAEVRLTAVDNICTIAINNVELLPISVYRKLMTRKDDKKFDIANSAIIGLSRIFERYISSQWPDDWDPTLGTSSLFIAFPVETRERLCNIPGAIISCFGQNDNKQMQNVAYRMFNEKILPKQASQQVRAQIFVSCYRSLDDSQKKCLEKGISRLVKFRSNFTQCISAREKLKKINAKALTGMTSTTTTTSTSANATNQNIENARQRSKRLLDQNLNILSQYLPNEKIGKGFYQMLFNKSDEKIFKILSKICDPRSVSGCDFSKSTDKFKQYLAKSLIGKKSKSDKSSSNNSSSKTNSSAAKLSKYFYNFHRMLTTKFVFHNESSIGEISKIAKLCYDDNDIGKVTSVLKLISLLSIDTEQPTLISYCVPNMALMMSSKNVYVAEASLRTISKLINAIDSNVLSKCMTSDVQKCLLGYCSNAGGTKHAKYAIRILAVVQGTSLKKNENDDAENNENLKARLKFWGTILKDLTSDEKLSVRNMYLDAVLMSLATCLEALPQNAFKSKYREKINTFVANNCTPRPGKNKKSIQPNLQSAVQVSSIKWLCNKLINSPYKSRDSGDAVKLQEEAYSIINTLRRFVRDSTDDNVRLAAGCAFLKIACDKYLENFIDVRSWNYVGILARDNDDDICEKFCMRLVKLLSQEKIRNYSKWGSLIVLRSLVSDKIIRDDGQDQLSQIMSIAKRIYKGTMRKTNGIRDQRAKTHAQQVLRDLYRHESLIAYAIYLLGNHTATLDDEKYTIKRRAVAFMMKPFKQNGFENFDYLLQILNTIDQSTANYGKTQHTRLIAELLLFELKKKRKSNKANYFGGSGGEPRLPVYLFMKGPDQLQPLLNESFFENLKGGKNGKSSKFKSPGTKRRKSRSPSDIRRKSKNKKKKKKKNKNQIEDSFSSQNSSQNSSMSSMNSSSSSSASSSGSARKMQQRSQRSPMFQLSKP